MDTNKQLQESDTDGKWANMDENILLKIFMALNIVDLVMRVSRVCKSWHKVAQEPCLWGAIDMDKIMNVFSEPNNHDFLSLEVMQKLKAILDCSAGNVTSFICSTYLDIDVSSWVFIADRTPMLKKLVLPLPESMTLSGFCEAVKRWPTLESLSAAGVNQPKRLLKAIAENCLEFSELKHMGVLDREFAQSIIAFLPNLKVLSLRGSLIHKGALGMILELLENLEVLNISHCLLVPSPGHEGSRSFCQKPNEWMLEKAARLKSFIVCKAPSCPKCLRAVRHYRGLSNGWFDYDEGFWKVDEVSCFTG